jgi:acylphosphatase
MNTILCKQYRIEGRVQGVFYRANTQKLADQLGLTGFARNEEDGTVTVVACGEMIAIEALEDWLWQGPPAATVDRVIEVPCEDKTFSDFTAI